MTSTIIADESCGVLRIPNSGGAYPAFRGARARSYSGDYIDLLNPDWRVINLNDMARALSAIPRWNGHTSRIVSVAEHQLVGADLVPRRFRLAFLLHDAHEFIIGDLVRPLTNALAHVMGETSQFKASLEHIKSKLDVAICRKFLSDADLGFHPVQLDAMAALLADEMRCAIVKKVDDDMGAHEKREMWPSNDQPAVSFGGEPQRIFGLSEPARTDVAKAWLEAVRSEVRHVYRADPAMATAKTSLGQ